VVLISLVESVAAWLVTKSVGTLGTNLFCYRWGDGFADGVLVTSTGGNNPDRFIDGDVSRINYTFINILVRNDDMATGLSKAEEIRDLFEKNIVTNCVSNKPRRDEVIYVGPENTINGLIHYFGIDVLVKHVKSNT
jgi:hypothetical protein